MLIGAVEAGGTKFVYGIGNEKGKVIERFSTPTTKPDETFKIIGEYFASKDVEKIGIGSFGPIGVSPNTPTYGEVLKTPKPHWQGANFITEIQKYKNVPIIVDTDVNAGVLGEAIWGVAKGLKNCVYITIGTGIGAGVLVGGKLVHGLLHPEAGHFQPKRHKEELADFKGVCPFHGDCLEGLASGKSLGERWQMNGADIPPDHPQAWELEGYYLAQAVSNFILYTSPEKIILGGGVMHNLHLFPIVHKHVKQLLNGYIQHDQLLENIHTYIVPPQLGDNAGLLGSIALTL